MKTGTLYIIASPIGNLEDITLRALGILKETAGSVFCEDTRQTRKLLSHYGIRLPVQSLHAHSPEAKIDQALAKLKEGISVAYLTDSGTPGISDPGSRLVRAARAAGFPVVPLPGASALAAIISVSGFPEKNILFAGFISKKQGKRKKELERLRGYDGVIVLYESPYRIKKLVQALFEVFPEAEAVIGREMTKMYEEYITGTISDIHARMDTIREQGEFTVAVFNSL